MDLGLSPDQSLLADAFDRIIAGRLEVPSGEARPYLTSAGLEQDLIEGGYLETCRAEGGGPLDAVLLIEAVARTPFAVEVGASALVGPMMALEAPARPLAVAIRLGEPVRFLQDGGALLFAVGDEVRLVRNVTGAVPVASAFAYPFAHAGPLTAAGSVTVAGADVAAFRSWRQVALCAEATGAMRSAFDLTVRYVAEREQFGRPIGAFQAVQHRLAECACLLGGARLMTLKAASSRAPVDAALAAAFVQQTLAQLIYETNQLHGAIGLTLEYPLHYWSYRMRVLQGELGGASAQAAAAAAMLWPKAAT